MFATAQEYIEGIDYIEEDEDSELVETNLQNDGDESDADPLGMYRHNTPEPHQHDAASPVLESRTEVDEEEENPDESPLVLSPRKKRKGSTKRHRHKVRPYPAQRAPRRDPEWKMVIQDGTRAEDLTKWEMDMLLESHSSAVAPGLGFTNAGPQHMRADGSSVQLQRCCYSKESPPCSGLRRILGTCTAGGVLYTVEEATATHCLHEHTSCARATGLPGDGCIGKPTCMSQTLHVSHSKGGECGHHITTLAAHLHHQAHSHMFHIVTSCYP